jgi:hypothetical protein
MMHPQSRPAKPFAPMPSDPPFTASVLVRKPRNGFLTFSPHISPMDDPRPPLSALTATELLRRAEEYRTMAAAATTADIRDALLALANRFALLAAQRQQALARMSE